MTQEEENSCCYCHEDVSPEEWCEEYDCCETCFGDEFYPCDECGSFTHTEDTRSLYDSYYCERCWEDVVFTCAYCDCTSLHEDSIYSEEQSGFICSSCYDEHFVSCFRCSETVSNYRYDSYRRENYCNECFEGDGSVHEWDFRPDFQIKLHRSDRSSKWPVTFGTEVEVVTDDLLCSVDHFSNSDLFYLKNDGSIDGAGFEIVSHPYSLAWAKLNQKEFELLWTAPDISAFRESSCGMHIHVGRRAFTSRTHLLKFCSLFMNHKDFTEIISRRTGDGLDSWAACEPVNASYVINSGFGRRYRAVNLCNYDTVEVRVFQSTATRIGYFANVQLVDGAVGFCRNVSLLDVNPVNFIEYMHNNKKEYPEYDFLFGDTLPVILDSRLGG